MVVTVLSQPFEAVSVSKYVPDVVWLAPPAKISSPKQIEVSIMVEYDASYQPLAGGNGIMRV